MSPSSGVDRGFRGLVHSLRLGNSRPQQDRDVGLGLMGAGSREKDLQGILEWMGLTSQDWTGTPHLS